MLSILFLFFIGLQIAKGLNGLNVESLMLEEALVHCLNCSFKRGASVSSW